MHAMHSRTLAPAFALLALLWASPAPAGFIVEIPSAQGARSSSNANSINPTFTLTGVLEAFIDGRSDTPGTLVETELKFAVPANSPGDEITSALVTLSVNQLQKRRRIVRFLVLLLDRWWGQERAIRDRWREQPVGAESDGSSSKPPRKRRVA
jgi:hypothetical protein